MTIPLRLALLWAAFATLSCATPTAAPGTASTPSARVLAIADAVVADVFAARPSSVAQLRPPGARYDTLPDESLDGVAARERQWEGQLAELRAIDRGALDDERAQLAYDLARGWTERALALRACRPELWRVSQMGGWQVALADLASAQPVANAALRKQALTRFSRIPGYVDTQIAALRAGLAQGWSAPRLVVDHVVRQLDVLLAATPLESSPFASPALRGENAEFRAEFLGLVRDAVNPALRRYRDFLGSEYAPAARATLAVSATPGGIACYRASLASSTTLDLPPEEVHARGLAAVAEIERAMAEISARSFGAAPARELLERLRSAPEYLYRDEAHILAHARQAMDRASAALPRAFARLPRARATLEPIPAYQARTAAAHYLSAALDGSRPGIYRVRTVEAAGQSWAQGESVAFHEIVPGHHLQIALANESAALPDIARFLFTSGFTEGWALYAEQLADELGLYSSDVDRMGMLSSRALRAARMVVDTGIHALGWERERAVVFLLAHTALSRLQAEQEIDRYVAQPGQAPSYYLGYQEILALRGEAQQRLGARFDMRAFHELVLGGGSATLPLLRERVRGWVAAEARAPAASPPTAAAPELVLDGSPLKGRVRFEVFGGPGCSSPVGICSRETYSGGLSGLGETVVQEFIPSDPSHVHFIQEDEVLHLEGGDLVAKISAAYDSASPGKQVSSLHVVTGGTGRHAGASGYIHLWGNSLGDAADHEYVASIRTPR